MYYSVQKKCSMGIALMLLGGMVLAGCGNADADEAQVSDIVVDMQQAEVGSLTLQNSFVGTVSPQELVYVIPFASGTVTEVNYSVGDYVYAGDVLFKIDDAGARLQLEQAQLSAANARQQVNMATGSQQKSTDLQLESSKVQAQSGYEQAQIAYYQVRNSYDQLNDAVTKYEEMVEQFEQAVSSGNTIAISQMQAAVAATLPEDSNSTVSGGNTGSPQSVLGGAKAQLETMRSNRNTLYNSLLQADSAYRAAGEGLDILEDTMNLTQGEIRSEANAQAGASLALAQLGVDSAELALSYYTVTAPISGVIQSRGVEVNGIAGSSSPAFTIANERNMMVTFQVGENVKNTLRVGNTVTVERNGQTFEGSITEIGVAVNPQTGLFQVKASVDADGSALPGGVSVKLMADTYSIDNTVLIPYDAVYHDNSGAYVYLCVDGRAAKTYVATDIFDDTTIAVTDGISKGDTVITSWSPRLLDGVQVAASGTAQE